MSGFWVDSDFLMQVSRASEEEMERRDLMCYWAARELGRRVTDLAKRIGISQPAVSYAILRGERVVREKGLQLVPK